jgi:1-acyl-sn-glycerol-3-phosphate acyltransferase
MVTVDMKTGAPILPVHIPVEKKPFRSINVVIGKPYTIEKIKGGSEVYPVYAEELMQKIEELKP